jgi:hypothetical protein
MRTRPATPDRPDVQNYFNYFTEIEERFQRRRGTILLLSTLDWALIETWKNAGIPLDAVLRGIDSALDKYDKRPRKARKVNSLAYCSQEVLAAAEDMKEAATGAKREISAEDAGLAANDVAAYLRKNAEVLRHASVGALAGAFSRAAESLEQAAAEDITDLEALERRLTVIEEKLTAALMANASDAELLKIREQADRDIAPYRSKMTSPQIEQLHRQYVSKRLLEQAKIPRLSLFYM